MEPILVVPRNSESQILFSSLFRGELRDAGGDGEKFLFDEGEQANKMASIRSSCQLKETSRD